MVDVNVWNTFRLAAISLQQPNHVFVIGAVSDFGVFALDVENNGGDTSFAECAKGI